MEGEGGIISGTSRFSRSSASSNCTQCVGCPGLFNQFIFFNLTFYYFYLMLFPLLLLLFFCSIQFGGIVINWIVIFECNSPSPGHEPFPESEHQQHTFGAASLHHLTEAVSCNPKIQQNALLTSQLKMYDFQVFYLFFV